DREKEWTQDVAGGPSLASELVRVNAELDRLRAILREHGIDPGPVTTPRRHPRDWTVAAGPEQDDCALCRSAQAYSTGGCASLQPPTEASSLGYQPCDARLPRLPRFGTSR